MKLIIDISDEVKASIDRVGLLRIPDEQITEIDVAIQNGKPLDLIRAEIDRQGKWLLQAGYTAYNVDIAFDAIKSVEG